MPGRLPSLGGELLYGAACFVLLFPSEACQARQLHYLFQGAQVAGDPAFLLPSQGYSERLSVDRHVLLAVRNRLGAEPTRFGQLPENLVQLLFAVLCLTTSGMNDEERIYQVFVEQIY
jgi:hypothetical protein